MPEFDPFQPINKEEFKTSDLPGATPDSGEIDPESVGMDDIDLGQGDAEESLDDFESELGAEIPDTPDLGASPELPQPVDITPVEPEKQVKWTAVPTDDSEIKSKHVGGFILRAKPLSSKQGDKVKYITQLYKGEKIIEKGVIWIDSEKDPRTFLQNVSDRILNRMKLTSNEIEKPKEPEAVAPMPEATGQESGIEPTESDLPKEEEQDELSSDMDEIMGSV